jgi:hypothetical protein
VRHALIASALLLLGCRSSGGFVTYLPAALPDVSRWQKMSGSAEIKNPDGRLEYELFVNPLRLGQYSVSRYRLSLRNQEGRDAYPSSDNEKLQWDRDGSDVRRFECNGGGRNCAWRELPKGLAAYDSEMPALLRTYALHAEVLRRRDAGTLR